MSDLIKLEKDNDVTHMLINRPEAFNAFNFDLLEALAKNLISLAMDNSVSAIIISGVGKAFCAGGDLKWALNYPGGSAAAFHELAARFHLGITEIRRMKKPVIAAVNGVAAGGGFSLALACDFRVMAKTAIMRQSYTSAGLCLDGGGTYSLPRLVGMARAMEIIAFDKPISSERAMDWGLVTNVVEDGTAIDKATEMAREILKGSLNSFGRAKELITDSFDTPFEIQIERERKGISECSTHPDGQEGLKAFAEKRKPVFNVK